MTADFDEDKLLKKAKLANELVEKPKEQIMEMKLLVQSIIDEIKIQIDVATKGETYAKTGQSLADEMKADIEQQRLEAKDAGRTLDADGPW